MNTIKTYRLAPLFVWDHWSRALPEADDAISDRVVETKRQMVVELNELGYDELLSDARYYATEMVAAGFTEGRGLCRSAAAVVRALEKQGRPEPKNACPHCGLTNVTGRGSLVCPSCGGSVS